MAYPKKEDGLRYLSHKPILVEISIEVAEIKTRASGSQNFLCLKKLSMIRIENI